MRSTLATTLIAAITTAASAGIATQTITIDFDDQMGGLPGVETDGLFNPHATFSTEPDHLLLIVSGSDFVGGSGPNSLTAMQEGSSDFDSDIYIDFTQAANNVSLDILADNDRLTVAQLHVFHSMGSSFVDVMGNANFQDPIPMDLSNYTDITRIELVNITDEFGLGIDNLVFDIPVPAPSALALLTLGALTTQRRRR